MRKRTSHLLLGVVVLLVVLFAWSGVAWATTFSNPVDANYSHIDNSVYLSQADFKSGSPAAVLAGSENYTDALTAAVLAKAAGGPLLLTSSTSLSSQVQTELVRLKVTKVYIVGLSTTVVNAVKAALPTLTSAQIVVLTGTDKYQTAALVASQVKQVAGKAPARVFIVPGDVYGSSLAAAAVAAANGWPILLTPQAGPFPSASAQEITTLGVTTGVEVDTSVSPGVSGFNVEKTIVGTGSTTDDPGNRYTESLAVADYAVQQGWAAYTHLAIGEEEGGSVPYTNNFPDNVLLARHIASENGAYLLTRSTGLYSTVANLLKAQGKNISSVEFMRPDYLTRVVHDMELRGHPAGEEPEQPPRHRAERDQRTTRGWRDAHGHRHGLHRRDHGQRGHDRPGGRELERELRYLDHYQLVAARQRKWDRWRFSSPITGTRIRAARRTCTSTHPVARRL